MSSEWADQPAPGAGTADKSAASLADNHGVPGRTLAAQREAMGWSVEQVADQLKMAVRQVIALEAGDYASLPGPAVVRGFVRAYAKVVKLDAAPLVALIALDTPAPNDATNRTVRRDKPASFSEVRFPTNGKKRSGLPLGLIGAVVVLAAAAAGAWQFGFIPASLMGNGSSANAPAAASPQASVTVLPPPIVADKAGANGAIETTLVKPGDELKPVQNTSVPLISVPPVTNGSAAPANIVSPAAATAPDVAAAAAAPVPAPAGGNALVIRVREDSWIEVRRAKGSPLLSRLVRGGSVETLEVAEPVTLIVGKPSAVEATLRGTAVALPSAPGTTVSRVKLQ